MVVDKLSGFVIKYQNNTLEVVDFDSQQDHDSPMLFTSVWPITR